MTANDQQKVLNAGFTIIRVDATPTLRIKVKTAEWPEWRTLEKGFTNAFAVNKRVQELLKDIKTVQD